MLLFGIPALEQLALMPAEAQPACIARVTADAKQLAYDAEHAAVGNHHMLPRGQAVEEAEDAALEDRYRLAAR